MREVELITRLHSAKAISIECVSGGRASMTADTMIAIVAMVAADRPAGMNAVFAKYLDDGQAAERCTNYLVSLAPKWQCPRVDLAPFFAVQAVAAYCNKPLVSQRQSLKALHKRHGTYANRSKQRTKKFNLALKKARIAGDKASIERYEQLIEDERQALNRHAEKKAQESDWCPRCSGTGNVAVRLCPECSGTGHVLISKKRMRDYVKRCGVEMSDKLFEAMWRYFEACSNQLTYDAGDAMRALAKRMKTEKAVSED